MSDNFSPAVLYISLEPKTKADEQKLGHGLQALAAEMLGYATDLRSRTQGRATYSMYFDRYDPRSVDDAEGPDDPMVREPNRPMRPSKSSRVALPEPNVDNDEVG
jgi:translation elongation factor EF-G